MDKLFCNLLIEEQDKVPLAAYCLEDKAYRWWLHHFEKRLAEIHPPWKEFRKLLYSENFKDRTK